MGRKNYTMSTTQRNLTGFVELERAFLRNCCLDGDVLSLFLKRCRCIRDTNRRADSISGPFFTSANRLGMGRHGEAS